jgi:hypothetical protein
MQIRDLDLSYTRCRNGLDAARARSSSPGRSPRGWEATSEFAGGTLRARRHPARVLPGRAGLQGRVLERAAARLRPRARRTMRGGVTLSVLPIAPPDTYTVDILGDMHVQLGTPTRISMTGRGQRARPAAGHRRLRVQQRRLRATFRAGVDFGGDGARHRADRHLLRLRPALQRQGPRRRSASRVSAPSVAGAISDKGVAACASERRTGRASRCCGRRSDPYGSLFVLLHRRHRHDPGRCGRAGNARGDAMLSRANAARNRGHVRTVPRRGRHAELHGQRRRVLPGCRTAPRARLDPAGRGRAAGRGRPNTVGAGRRLLRTTRADSTLLGVRRTGGRRVDRAPGRRAARPPTAVDVVHGAPPPCGVREASAARRSVTHPHVPGLRTCRACT